MANVRAKLIATDQSSLLPDEKVTEIATSIEKLTCEDCDAESDLKYCSACTDLLCDTCWDRRKKHRDNRPGPGGIPHEKNSLSVVHSIKKRTAEPHNETEQTQLHKADEDTTWIGLDRDTGGDPVLAEYRRYAAIMMASATENSGTRYPRLVSFIGETAAGKSTLIKLLLDVNGDTADSSQGSAPVIGRAALEKPTSADVHLYLDAKTSTTAYPILLADCEGFNGGEADPVATQSMSAGSAQPAKPGIVASSHTPRKLFSRANEVIQRPLQWARRENAGTEEKRKRSYAVSQMYPRIFYAFSDVVVYVLKNPRTLEEVVEKLLNWAHTHRQKSVNVPTKPHVVIALNQSHHSTSPEQWDSTYATAHLLSSTTAKIHRNETFQRYADEKQNANFNITNMRDLLKCYYYDIHVVRLPDKDRFELLHTQAQTLYKVISECCDESTEFKKSKRMLPDVDQFGLYLKMSFDHFATSLDVPFDYIEASLRHQPPPKELGDNLTVFTRLAAKNLGLYEKRGDESNRELFDLLTPMVASCIMLDCSRKQRLGLSKEWFSNSIAGQNRASYQSLCVEVIETYASTCIPCEHIIRKPGILHREPKYCSVRKSTHQDQHSGDQWGRYESTFRCAAYNWPGKILDSLRELEKVYSRFDGSSLAHVRATTHQKRLHDFYESAGGAQRFKANSICLCCLSGLPEHHLICGHFLCAACVRDYGKWTANRLEIDSCPLHDRGGIERISTSPTVVTTYPPYSGLRVLVLDGGGARGIVELSVMRAIEQRLDVPLQSFFDLVIGTSTGGIIALGFGDQLWPVEKCISKFKELVSKAFTPRSMQTSTYALKYVQMLVKHSIYRTVPIVEALKEAFGEETVLFGSQNSREDHRRLKVGVTATTSGGNRARLLANFYSPGTPPASVDPLMAYQHVRPTVPANELRVWEAARSTSAAPGFFKPFDKQCVDEGFDALADGGILHNNPVNIAFQETQHLAETHHLSKTPDIIVSLGTGLPQEYHTAERKPSRLHQIREVVREKKPFLSLMWNMFETQLKLNMDSERRWQLWEQNTSHTTSDWKSRYFRLNPDLGMEPPPMDDWKKLPALENMVRGWTGDGNVSAKIDKIVHTLVACSFYFEHTGSASAIQGSDDGLVELRGSIKCRLCDTPADIRGLGRFLDRCKTSHPSCAKFVIDSATRDGLEIDAPIATMTEHGRFEPVPIRWMVRVEKGIENTISLSLGAEIYPISGFPRSLLEIDFRVV